MQDVSQVNDGRDVGRLGGFLAHRTAELLHLSAVASALQWDRATVERYMVMPEKLFLIRRLPAWSRNAANRLIKTPTVQVRDSGLAGTLGDLRGEGRGTGIGGVNVWGTCWSFRSAKSCQRRRDG